MFRNRSPIEIMTLVFTVTVAVTILCLGLSITIIEVNNPEADTDGAATVLFNLVSSMMGALLGLLAGKADTASRPPPPLSPPTQELPPMPPEQ